MGDLGARTRYDRWHRNLAVDHESDAPWHRLVKRYLQPGDLAGRRVLEIGCGRGGLASWLAQHPHRPSKVVAADFSEVAVKKGRAWAWERDVTRIAWAVNDIYALPHADGTFHTVISCETIEHLPDPCGALRELARVLKPGGRLLLTTPNYLGLMGLYRVYRRVRGRPYTEEGQPINRVTLLPLTVLWVKQAGLRVTAVDAVGHYLPFPGRPPIVVPRLDNPRKIMRWVALHSLVVSEKR